MGDHRRVKHMRRQLKAVTPDDNRATVEDVVTQTAMPLQSYVQGVKGPDGRWWVSTQIQQGSLALAFAVPPENVEDWLRTIGRDMRAMADQLRARNGGAQASGLIVAGPADVPRFPAT